MDSGRRTRILDPLSLRRQTEVMNTSMEIASRKHRGDNSRRRNDDSEAARLKSLAALQAGPVSENPEEDQAVAVGIPELEFPGSPLGIANVDVAVEHAHGLELGVQGVGVIHRNAEPQSP